MNIALYPRVSTQEQAVNGHSIDEQIDRMKKYCEAMGWTVYKVYTDAGFSGANTNRPALQRMIKDIKSNKIDKVLVYKLDRLSRSQKDTLELIEDVFLANDTDFVSMSENFDTSTPFGRAMIGILAVFAQLEREQIKERMMMGKEARAKKGKFHGSNFVPIGYKYENDELTPFPYEQMQVVEIFNLALKNKSPYAIADILKAKGFEHKHGEWSERAVRRILRSQTYIGLVKHNKEWYQGTHTPIIDQSTFDEVQRLLDKKAELHQKYNQRCGKANSYLGGFLYCKQCGAKYGKQTGKTKKKDGGYYIYEMYYCNSRARKNNPNICKDPNCQNRSWKVQELTDIVFNEIKQLAIDPNYITAIQSNALEDERPAIIEKEISKLDEQISRLLDLYTIGEMPLDSLQEKVHEMNDRKGKLEFELETIALEQKEKLSQVEALRIVQEFQEVLEGGNLDEVRTVISILIEKIELDNDEVNIHWNFV